MPILEICKHIASARLTNPKKKFIWRCLVLDNVTVKKKNITIKHFILVFLAISPIIIAHFIF